ncbi:MAG TPA: hypothetical protein DHW82_04040 [Spirochaetia bacterium]|nr:hypothetical protein [Spirochaetia bacterium]
MTTEEIQQLFTSYKKKTAPQRVFARFTVIASFILAVFFLGFGIQKCASGKLEISDQLLIAPVSLNESGKEEKKDETMTDENESKESEVQKEEWKKQFDTYAKKIQVNSDNLTYEMIFSIPGLPLDNLKDYEIAFEIYDKDKEYLFTFYGNYWNQDGIETGYDEGEYYEEYWHEEIYEDNVFVRFPYQGEFYITAGLPSGRNTDYNAIKNISAGKVKIKLYSNSNPFPASTIVAFIFFIIFGIFAAGLLVDHGLSKNDLLFNKFDFTRYTYLIELPFKKYRENYYHLAGFSVKQGQVGKQVELILEKDGQTTFFEMEKEVEVDDGETEINYYYYYYEDFPEEVFQTIPDGQVTYKNQALRKDVSSSKEYKVQTFYHNNLKEERTKKEVNFTNSNWSAYLSFEYTDDPSDFDVNYGYAAGMPKVWRIPK